MKIRLDEKEGLAAGTAIEVEGRESKKPDSIVTLGIWNDERYASVQLSADLARQIVSALIRPGETMEAESQPEGLENGMMRGETESS